MRIRNSTDSAMKALTPKSSSQALALSTGIAAGWALLSLHFMPSLIENVYYGQATPEILNSLIKGQSRHALEHYQAIWARVAVFAHFAIGCLLLLLLFHSAPRLRRLCLKAFGPIFSRLHPIGRALGLWSEQRQGLLQKAWDWFFKPCPHPQTTNSGMTTSRRVCIGAWCFFLVGMQVMSTLSRMEFWPFTPSYMYSKKHRSVFIQYEVCGIADNESVLIAGRNNHLSAKLSRLSKDPERLRAYMDKLGEKHLQMNPDQKPFDSLLLRRIGWKMTPYGSAESTPVFLKSLYEFAAEQPGAMLQVSEASPKGAIR